MSIHEIYAVFMKIFRPKRAKKFAEEFPLIYDESSQILDVGGALFPWSDLKPKANIKILNIEKPKNIPLDCKWQYVQGDGTNLQYVNNQFDLVFSNSVIEHVGDWDKQVKFANEILRVGKQIYIQTPNKWFFIEPHLITVFIHWLPIHITCKLIRYFSIWGLVNKPSQERINQFWMDTRLLSYSEIKRLFPNCTITREKVLGLTKSFIIMQ